MIGTVASRLPPWHRICNGMPRIRGTTNLLIFYDLIRNDEAVKSGTDILVCD